LCAQESNGANVSVIKAALAVQGHVEGDAQLAVYPGTMTLFTTTISRVAVLVPAWKPWTLSVP
jgi:hypothetical protein